MEEVGSALLSREDSLHLNTYKGCSTPTQALAEGSALPCDLK